MHVILSDRQQAHGGVAHQLDQDAARTDQDHWAIDRILAAAGDDLHAAGHFLDQEAVDLRLRIRRAKARCQRRNPFCHLLRGLYAEKDAADFGLVRKRGRDDFECHRKSDLRRRFRGILRRADERAPRQVDAVGIQESFEGGTLQIGGAAGRLGRRPRRLTRAFGIEVECIECPERFGQALEKGGTETVLRFHPFASMG